jgi:hypothetical protein
MYCTSLAPRDSASPAYGVGVGGSMEDEETPSTIAQGNCYGYQGMLAGSKHTTCRVENDVSGYSSRGEPAQGTLITREREHLCHTRIGG